MKVLVLGSTGFLGLHCASALVRQGHDVRCGRRRRSNVLLVKELGLPLVVADLDQPATLREAMTGVDTVVHCAAHYPRHSLHRDATLARALGETGAALDVAAECGVRRFVYVSSMATVAPSSRASDERDVHRAMPGHGVYHDVKWLLEQQVLAERRLQVVVAVPGACLGPWDWRLGTGRLLLGVAQGADVPHPDGWVNWVAASDVGRAVERLVALADPPRRVLLAAENRRLHDLLCEVARRLGVRAPPAPLAPDVARAFADAEEVRTLGTIERPRLAREIADLVVHGVPVSNALSRTALGLTYETLQSTLDTTLAWERVVRRLGPTAVLGDRP